MNDSLNLPQYIGILTEVRAGKAEYFARDKLSAINKSKTKINNKRKNAKSNQIS